MSSDVDAIQALFDEYDAGVNDGSVDRWIGVFADNAIFIAPDLPIMEGKKAIYDWAKEAFFDAFETMTVDNKIVDLVASEDQAYARLQGHFTGVLKDGGGTLNGEARAVAGFQKQSDGSWKYTSFIFNWAAPLG